MWAFPFSPSKNPILPSHETGYNQGNWAGVGHEV